MADRFSSTVLSSTAPGTRHYAITPSDSADLPVRPRAIRCNVAGTIVIRDELGTDLPYVMAVGEVLPFRGVRVLATGTTGTYYGID